MLKQLTKIHRRISFRAVIMLVIVITVAIALIISGLFVAGQTATNEETRTNQTIHNIGEAVRKNPVVLQHLKAYQAPASADNAIERYTHRIQTTMQVDAVVVMNMDLIRWSHPVKDQIGRSFLLRDDAAKSLNGKPHYSKTVGVLGPEYRYFTPVIKDGQQIGIVCITVTVKTVQAEILAAQKPILIGGLIGLLLGVFGAAWVSLYLRKRLLGMTPDQITAQVTELTALRESMSDGLIAIDDQRVIIQLNAQASQLFPALTAGNALTTDLYDALFHEAKAMNRPVAVRGKELIVSTTPLMAGKRNLGQLALVHDQSDYQQLVAQLAGTKQYIEALRAQQHEFMNKLQVISGLVELKQYDRLQTLVFDFHRDYQSEFGSLNSRIKLPAVTGFLLAKANEAHEQGKTFTVSEDSQLPALSETDTKIEAELIKVLGNLIDNALDAVSVKTGTVAVSLNYDEESRTILLEVADNGQGVAPALKDKILAKHFSTKGSDRGYGLALVNDVVKAHHGFLAIEDNEPAGTVMTVELPLAEKEDADDPSDDC
ncbi:ATP-binding protein [Lacticaseibacillus mingshuiensis]|uniref:ATP-binding protein n=1 Tax=Lacticaseibacillus mingshuiensis TaxID=2799574 RepID=UPI0019520061|nr:sensor histidine kinase [Lacticaseibacillus mingshuiensis]